MEPLTNKGIPLGLDHSGGKNKQTPGCVILTQQLVYSLENFLDSSLLTGSCSDYSVFYGFGAPYPVIPHTLHLEINPWFLHSNATSHTSVFSAIAELIDNAYDPDVSAKQLWIDKTAVKGQDCLIFMDNGNGLNYEKMHKMLSFGFSCKQAESQTESQTESHEPVGQYGNGFKSGSMRLGKDVIVFSKKHGIMCVGLLSQTYLEMKEYVVLPIVEFTHTGQNIQPEPKHAESLHGILTHSLFNTEEQLLSEFSVIDRFCTNSSGTRIIIWNLRRTFSRELEFDVMKDCYDIRIPDDDVYNRTREKLKRHAKGSISVPESEYSLRAYCSILYLKPRMEIILQGQKVKTQSVIKTLTNVYIDTYKPVCDPPLEKGIKITFGFNTNTKEHYGLMMYHKNRLIKAYQRVACQRRADIKGEGVIGVMECNHLTPTHNKQDFVYSEEYRKTMLNVGKKLEQYWKNYHYAYETNFTKPETVKQPDQNRVQCNDCLKWRKLPDGIDPKKLPEVWFCHMNPDPQFRTCVAEEEPGDSADELPIYTGTPKQHKKHQHGNTRHEQSTFTSSSSIQTTPHHSGATSAGTLHSPVLAVPKRKMKGLFCSYEKPEKKKARQKGLDDSDASKAECKDIKTAVKNEADEVIDKIMKEEGNQMPHFSFDDKNKCKPLYVQVLEAVRYLQDKLIELKKELKNEGVETKTDSLEYKCMLSNCFESLQQDFEEIKMKSENVELSVNDCSACSTEASKPESGTYKSGSEKGHLPSHLRLIELKKRVTHRLANLVPALKCARVTDEILSDVMNVMTPEEQVMLEKEAKFQEAHLSPEEECSTSTPPSHIGHHSVVTDVLLPEPDQRSTDRDAYRFLCSHAGQFHCKLTNLVFEMKGSGEVSYTVVPWDNSQLQGMGQFQPAGPLYNIKCSEDSIVYLHLPHCEIHTVVIMFLLKSAVVLLHTNVISSRENNRIELAVAHFSQENVEILQPLKITNTHVILQVRGLSLFGLFKKIFGGELNNAQVLLFYKENIGTQRWKKLHIHLLPGNVPVKEVQKENPGSTYLQCSSLCQLISGKKYKPLCEPYISQPKIETFVPNFGPNYHPTFEMILNSEVEDLTLGLLDETDLEVWEPRHVILTADNREAILSEILEGAEFVDKHRYKLIQRVSSVMEIADTLKTNKFISDEMYSEIGAENTNQHKMRKLYEFLHSAGRAAKAKFYAVLMEKQSCLVYDLEHE